MIQLKDVSVRYRGDLVALQPTSLQFRRGEFNVLLGASGAGKSTLLRCLNLLNPPTTGEVHVDGLGPVTAGPALLAHRRQTGMVFQQHQLISRHTALANVLLGRIGYHSTWRSLFPLPRAEQQIALDCLDRVGLLQRALDRVDRLSGGQQQRVGIARALAQQPRLMLADEPVASLDPSSSRKVLSRFKSICREDGITTVVSLHQVDLAREYADRVIGLARGRVVYDGSPAGLGTELLASIYDQGATATAESNGGSLPHTHPSLDLAYIED
ncbi:MAG: phosphonate ABC transporter ATP-binding protein [Rhodocyclales bacterium]|nr:phosphonate ABC transporter ATP-binding protein [Rhodocyclales bacterium]